MPSRHSFVAGPALPSLFEIIKLEPEKEPWCAGYAPLQGRRCHARTNACGRSSAMALLHQGTKDLRAGRCIDELLEDLAPHVLCTRFHQSQASGLARRWQRKVRSFLDTPASSIRAERQTSRSSRSPYPGTTHGNMEERTALLYRRLRDTMEELRHLEAALDEPTFNASPAGDRDARHTSADVASISVRGSHTRNVHSAIISNSSVTRQTTESVNRPANTTPRPVQLHVDRQGSLLPPSSARPATVSNVAWISDEDTSRYDPAAARQAPVRASRSVAVIRREVAGECGICLCDLKTLQGENNEDEDEDTEDECDEMVETASEETELDWCKARCGVNFHKHCIDQWLETAHAATCPACRSNWTG
ncbi:hypothetical protein N7526_000129 [Penicillium atrosanguineum]|nr:hypothetical protein N7526_000129 [Penicillium atrosanguineum]